MDMKMDMGMGHVSNTTQPPKDQEYPDTYFAHTEHSGVIYTHIALMVLSWVFLLPIGKFLQGIAPLSSVHQLTRISAVMFSLARSRFTLPAQLVFLASNALGLVLGVIYNAQTPDLYPNNAHHKIGWIVTWVVCAQVLISAVGFIAGALKGHENKPSGRESHSFLPVSTRETRFSHHGYHDDNPYRTSDDSGRGTEPDSPSLQSDSVSTLNGMESPPQHPRKEYEDDEDLEELSLSSAVPQGTFARHASKMAASRVWKYLDIARKVIDRIILPFGSIALATGVATFGRFFVSCS
jgi:hypothetical protein